MTEDNQTCRSHVTGSISKACRADAISRGFCSLLSMNERSMLIPYRVYFPLNLKPHIQLVENSRTRFLKVRAASRSLTIPTLCFSVLRTLSAFIATSKFRFLVKMIGIGCSRASNRLQTVGAFHHDNDQLASQPCQMRTSCIESSTISLG